MYSASFIPELVPACRTRDAGILQVIANSRLDVRHAIIEIRRGKARDRIHFKGPDGRKVLDSWVLEKLESGLRTVLTSKE